MEIGNMQQPDNDNVVAEDSTSLIAETPPPKIPSLAARIGCIVLGVGITAWAAYTSFLSVLLLPVFLSPTIYFFYYNSRLPQGRQANPERLYWSYLGTVFPGTPLATLVQAALIIPFISLAFGSQKDFFWHEFETVHKESDIRDDAHRAARAAFTATPAYWAFAVFLSYIDAGATEELLKYAVVMIAKRKQEVVREVDYIMYGAASGLSFATLEGLGYVIPECASESAGKILLTLIERMGVGIPLHVICGTLTAVNLARVQLKGEKLNFLRIVGPATFFHGSMNFVLLGYCAWAGHVGWVHPEHVGSLLFVMVGVMLVVVAAAFTLRSSLAKLNSGIAL